MSIPFAVIDLEAFSCRHRVVVDASADVARIERFTRATLDHLDRAASRFRYDSELFTLNTRSRQAAAHREGRFETELSVFLAAAMRAALRTAALTDGLVVPHLGRQIIASGYDADITAVRRAGDEWPYRAQAPRTQNGTAPGAPDPERQTDPEQAPDPEHERHPPDTPSRDAGRRLAEPDGPHPEHAGRHPARPGRQCQGVVRRHPCP